MDLGRPKSTMLGSSFFGAVLISSSVGPFLLLQAGPGNRCTLRENHNPILSSPIATHFCDMALGPPTPPASNLLQLCTSLWTFSIWATGYLIRPLSPTTLPPNNASLNSVQLPRYQLLARSSRGLSSCSSFRSSSCHLVCGSSPPKVNRLRYGTKLVMASYFTQRQPINFAITVLSGSSHDH